MLDSVPGHISHLVTWAYGLGSGCRRCPVTILISWSSSNSLWVYKITTSWAGSVNTCGLADLINAFAFRCLPLPSLPWIALPVAEADGQTAQPAVIGVMQCIQASNWSACNRTTDYTVDLVWMSINWTIQVHADSNNTWSARDYWVCVERNLFSIYTCTTVHSHCIPKLLLQLMAWPPYFW